MVDNKIIQKLRRVFSQNPNIVSAYVFGTYATDKAKIESDFDLAVVVRDVKKTPLKKVYSLIEHLSFPKDLDLSVVDHSSSPLLLNEIVKNGKRIYMQDTMQSIDFEAYVLYKYYDTAHIRNIYFSYLSEKFNQKRYARQ